MQFGVGEHGIAGARGGGGIVLGGDGGESWRLDGEELGGAGEDGLGKAEPGDGTAAGHVVEAGPVLWCAETAGEDAGDDEVRGAGEFDGSRGPADLVVDDGETVALAGQAKHGEKKIVAVGAVDPTGAEDEEFAADALDGLLAGELAGAVDIERIGRVRLDPRRDLGSDLLPSKT